MVHLVTQLTLIQSFLKRSGVKVLQPNLITHTCFMSTHDQPLPPHRLLREEVVLLLLLNRGCGMLLAVLIAELTETIVSLNESTLVAVREVPSEL